MNSVCANKKAKTLNKRKKNGESLPSFEAILIYLGLVMRDTKKLLRGYVYMKQLRREKQSESARLIYAGR